MWRYEVFAGKLTWYFTGVYVIKKCLRHQAGDPERRNDRSVEGRNGEMVEWRNGRKKKQILRNRGARWKVGGLTIENFFFSYWKTKKRNKIIAFDLFLTRDFAYFLVKIPNFHSVQQMHVFVIWITPSFLLISYDIKYLQVAESLQLFHVRSQLCLQATCCWKRSFRANTGCWVDRQLLT